ncbi:PEP-CTERM/exosortase system-associated acyltransferase [Ectothiorhodospira shaposhnikovii]|uniref:PEP-CTERM/exosortase system-associated acyltransferase n=1 Tax=Ectothiorhodospira shaposhnikovii TaxID=1054 RepID=UPI00190848C1|nr:PEP-CTERM/exosortase system-associated acyltransferase [Ectothiorhodospira shaposhnikovii]MBK1672841.1 hypothetical protein [Ectothiorhodospira shaposhnikovii]
MIIASRSPDDPDKAAAPSAVVMDAATTALGALNKWFTLQTCEMGCSNPNLSEIFALRYRTYCEERGFLPISEYPDGLERDPFDQRSAHFTARNTQGNIAGTVRLVLSPGGEPFPFEYHCPPFENFLPPPASLSAEVSRLAVSRSYRRRTGDTWFGVNESDGMPAPKHLPGQERRSNSPLLVLGLYRQMYRYSCEKGIQYWYAAMEKSLIRILSRFDFVFEPIGEERDYYGPVTPYLADLREIERRLQRTRPELLRWFQHAP